MSDESRHGQDSARLFLPRSGNVEVEALRGYVAAHSASLTLTESPLFVHTTARRSSRVVGIVSGGGSGHEPLHVGFVGAGGLDAAVPGKVFASPHNAQVLAASKEVAGEGGVLMLIKNYTGDRIHFGIAAERLAADGVPVAQLVIDDDVASDDPETGTGRRGTGGTVVVEKILGALADRGAGLAELTAFGSSLVAETRSLAVATGPLTSFATGRPAFEIAEGVVEYGIGIHGEPARETIETPSLDALLEKVVDGILGALPSDTTRVIAVVNGLGSTTPLELGAITHQLELTLASRGVAIDSALVGTFVSALDMRGFMVTLTVSTDERLDLWLAEAVLAGMPATSPYVPQSADQIASEDGASARPDPLLDALAEAVHAAHGQLTRLDQLAGDGDFGDNLVAGVAGARRNPDGLRSLASSFLDEVGGSSGPLIGLLLAAIASEFPEAGAVESATVTERFRSSISTGLDAIQRVGNAQPGDRTMVDALHPGATAASADLAELVGRMADGALSTGQMLARRGRASYVGERALGAPDAGAVGIVLVLANIAAQLDPSQAEAVHARAVQLLAALD